jgi:hypothetical protein
MAYYDYGSGNGGVLSRGILKLQEIGVMDVILPFILVFTIVFAVMQKTKILGEDPESHKPRKNFNAVIALVMALGVVIPHITGTYPANADIVNIVNSALPNISVVLIAVVMMLLMIGVFGGGVDISKSKNLSTFAMIFAIVGTVYIFGSSADWWNMPSWMGFMMDSDTQALVIILLVFGALIAFITAEDKPKDPKKYGFGEDLARAMGYKKDQ